MIRTSILSFNELDAEKLYEILALRADVFVVEQSCVYQDLDFKDQQAKHLLVYAQDKLIGYARLLSYNKGTMSFGRLVTAPSHRGQGLGKQLMDFILSYLETHHPEQAIKITAQSYLQGFYESYGFEVEGEPFDLDGIPHLLMVKAL